MTATRWKQNMNMARLAMAGAGFAGMLALTACVQIDAPDKPIEINLNINIRQEVVYRLDGDAKELIEEQADIF
ncbi:MAG: hypothetical protein RLZZ58_279 [Pseudomonadota bacterium]